MSSPTCDVNSGVPDLWDSAHKSSNAAGNRPENSESVALRDVRRRLGEATRKRSVAKGVAIFLVVATLYATSWSAIFLAPWWLLKLGLAYVNGMTIGMLFLIGHDACHQGLTPVGWLNRLLGRLAFLPSLHPYAGWEFSHNAMHHGWPNLKGRDPGYAPFSPDEWAALPTWRRMLERIYRSSGGLWLFYLVENWLKCELFPPRSDRERMVGRRMFPIDQVIVLAYATFVIGLSAFLGVVGRANGASAWLAGLGHVALGWVLPFIVWNGVIAFITFQQHTHPRIRWFDDEAEWSFYETQVRGTVHIEFPWILRILLHNINEHTAHHINPRVPLYELKSAQDDVRRTLGDDVIVLHWSPGMTADTLRCCKLYDYRGHRWLDFSGRPTAVLGAVAAA